MPESIEEAWERRKRIEALHAAPFDHAIEEVLTAHLKGDWRAASSRYLADVVALVPEDPGRLLRPVPAYKRERFAISWSQHDAEGWEWAKHAILPAVSRLRLCHDPPSLASTTPMYVTRGRSEQKAVVITLAERHEIESDRDFCTLMVEGTLKDA